MVVAALTAFLTALTTTSCMGHGLGCKVLMTFPQKSKVMEKYVQTGRKAVPLGVKGRTFWGERPYPFGSQRAGKTFAAAAANDCSDRREYSQRALRTFFYSVDVFPTLTFKSEFAKTLHPTYKHTCVMGLMKVRGKHEKGPSKLAERPEAKLNLRRGFNFFVPPTNSRRT